MTIDVDGPIPDHLTTGDAVLEIRGLDVDYGVGERAVRAVSEVNLTVRRGEVLGLAGESGSGKSTLAYGLTRLLPPPGVVADGKVIYHPGGGSEPVDVLALSPTGLRGRGPSTLTTWYSYFTRQCDCMMLTAWKR